MEEGEEYNQIITRVSNVQRLSKEYYNNDDSYSDSSSYEWNRISFPFTEVKYAQIKEEIKDDNMVNPVDENDPDA